MKTQLLLTLGLIIFFLNVAKPQDNEAYRVYYEMTFRKDSTESTRTSEMVELLINGDTSLFRTVFQGQRDSNEFHKDLLKKPYPYAHTNAQYRIFKDYNNENIVLYEKIEPFGPFYTYTERQEGLDWELTDDTLTINNLHCQKAQLSYGNRLWEAWFCADIPVNDGPYKFWGLPGLIVRVYDNTNSWKFDLDRIEHAPTARFDVAFLGGAVPVRKKEFYARKLNYRDNRLQINEAAGKMSFPDEKAKQRLYKLAKIQALRDNNWIEIP